MNRARMMESYRSQYGTDTDALFAAMEKPQEKIALLNPFLPSEKREMVMRQAIRPLSQYPQLVIMPAHVAPISVDGMLSHYFLDQSSIYAPLLLPISSASRVLDMCAAPGGKLLVMLSRKVLDVTFIANDISSARAERLRRVVHDYVPADVRSLFIRVTNKDAINFGLKGPQSFDAVLLDAPCSSEAHILNDPHLLNQFDGLRKSLPQRQFTLLSAALLATKPGGFVMYATCSINRLENEGVIAKALERKKIPCEVVHLVPPLGLANEYGTTILPHRDGAGPAFYSLIKRL